MGLRTKFNLVLILAFSIGMAGAGYISHEVLQQNARTEVLHTAGIIMESAMSVRGYTVDEIKPLLSEQMKDTFLPQTVPAYAAARNVMRLRNKYPEYTYKEATLNPTNPASRATEWESTVVEYFRNNLSEKELVGERQTATGLSLFVAHPIQIKKDGCLACHGTVEEAPATMLALYGSAGGFGWKLDEVVGSQIVSVPMTVALDRANETFQTFMVALGGIFFIVFIMINLLLHYIVVKPVKLMSAIAHDVSMGKLDVPECQPRGKDEVASLAESFNRMRRSLVNAMKMLDE